MFIIYAKMTEEQLRQAAAEAIPAIEAWFQANPDRNDCTAEFWYGKQKTILRDGVAAQVNELLEETLKKN